VTADPGSPYYEQLADLERRYPGWQFWTVPHGNPTTHVVWCARPWPLINADSPGELAGAVRAAHSQVPDGSPALASLRSYAARAKRLREFKEAATALWERRKAEQAARKVAIAADPVRRFYDRHEHSAGPEARVTSPCATAATASGEPGTA